MGGGGVGVGSVRVGAGAMRDVQMGKGAFILKTETLLTFQTGLESFSRATTKHHHLISTVLTLLSGATSLAEIPILMFSTLSYCVVLHRGGMGEGWGGEWGVGWGGGEEEVVSKSARGAAFREKRRNDKSREEKRREQKEKSRAKQSKAEQSKAEQRKEKESTAQHSKAKKRKEKKR